MLSFCISLAFCQGMQELNLIELVEKLQTTVKNLEIKVDNQNAVQDSKMAEFEVKLQEMLELASKHDKKMAMIEKQCW